jgi:hypothetical protein
VGGKVITIQNGSCSIGILWIPTHSDSNRNPTGLLV